MPCFSLQGLVQAVGVSNYGPKQMQKISRYLEKMQVPLVSAQVQFSLLSRGPQQMEMKAVCDDLGIQVIAYSPLALGLLTGMPVCCESLGEYDQYNYYTDWGRCTRMLCATHKVGTLLAECMRLGI